MADKKLTNAEIDAEIKAVGDALDAGEKVRIKIPADPLNKNDLIVPVGVNGKFYELERGKTIEVPAVVAEILENAGII